MKWIKLCPKSTIPEGKLREFKLQNQPIAIIHTAGQFFAIHGLCTHAKCALAGGTLAGYTLTCYCHGGQFDVRTGQVLALPPLQPVKTYPLKIENDIIFISILKEGKSH